MDVCLNHLFLCIYFFIIGQVVLHFIMSAVLRWFSLMVLYIMIDYTLDRTVFTFGQTNTQTNILISICIVTSITLYVPFLMQESFKWYAVLE